MKEQGQGSPEGAPTSQSQKNGQLKEAGKDYSGTLSSIRADQDLQTFAAGLCQNKEQLLSLARKLRVKPADKVEERRDNLALGVYLEESLKETYFSTTRREIDPGDYLDEDSDEALTEAERRETLAFWATERIASKWLVKHLESEAAKEVMHWNIYGFPDQHHKLLQEMWPEILLQLTSQ